MSNIIINALKTENQPVILVDTVYNFIITRLSSILPRTIEVYDSIYTMNFLVKSINLLRYIPEQLLSTRPIIFKDTDIAKQLLSPIVNELQLEWGLLYGTVKERKIGKKEVQLRTITQRLVLYKTGDVYIKQNVQIPIGETMKYLQFLEEESIYLDKIEHILQGTSSNIDYIRSIHIGYNPTISDWKDIPEELYTDTYSFTQIEEELNLLDDFENIIEDHGIDPNNLTIREIAKYVFFEGTYVC